VATASRRWGLVIDSIRILREDGIRQFWIHTIQSLGIYRRLIVMGGYSARMPEPGEVEIVCEELPPEQMAEYMSLREDQDPEMIKRRFDRGEVCLVSRNEGHIIAASWLATGTTWVDYLDSSLRLADDCVYAFDSFVHESFRGKRVANGLTRYRMHWIEQAGYKRAIGLIWPENKNSMQRVVRLNRGEIGDIVRYGIGPWQKFSVRLTGKHSDICTID
jgi:hypothetical protein